MKNLKIFLVLICLGVFFYPNIFAGKDSSCSHVWTCCSRNKAIDQEFPPPAGMSMEDNQEEKEGGFFKEVAKTCCCCSCMFCGVISCVEIDRVCELCAEGADIFCSCC